MPKKKKAIEKLSADKRAAKKAIVLGTEKNIRLPLVSTLVVAVLLIGGGIYYSQKEEKASPVVVSSSNISTTSVSYPADLSDDGKARHFSYGAGNPSKINYFVLKSSDGVIRAAFDACDVCWPAGKGYFQSGDFMVCRNCGRQFSSALINEIKGGCNPAPLNRKIEDGKVVIQTADILEGKHYFDFSRRSK
jgi:uncharacterized membrane protein